MSTNKIKNANKMLEDIRKKINSWNERSQFTIKGVKNLSRSDLDTITLYGEAIVNYGNYNCYMKPRGSVKDVLYAYGLGEKEDDF